MDPVDQEAEAGATEHELLRFARSIGLPRPTALQLQLVEVLRAMQPRRPEVVFYDGAGREVHRTDLMPPDRDTGSVRVGVTPGAGPAVDEAELGEHD